jgi:prophage regulatory protein
MTKPTLVNLHPPRLRRFIRLPEVERLAGLKAAAIYDKMSRGEFPRQVPLTDNPNARKKGVAWIVEEIVAWQEARIADRDAQPPRKPYRPRREHPDSEPAAL